MPTAPAQNHAARSAPPRRSRPQQMEALDRANEVRFYRAQLKRDLKAGRVHILIVLAADDELLASMHIFDLLLAVPKLGRVKVNEVLRRTRISPSKTIGGLTDRQRDELTAALRNRFARPTLFEDRAAQRQPRTEPARPLVHRGGEPALRVRELAA